MKPLTDDQLLDFHKANDIHMDCRWDHALGKRAGYANITEYADALLAAKQKYYKPAPVTRENLTEAMVRDNFEWFHDDWEPDQWDQKNDEYKSTLNSLKDEAFYAELKEVMEDRDCSTPQDFVDCFIYPYSR